MATCFASTAKIVSEIRQADGTIAPAAVDRYLTLLRSGGSDHPMRLLQRAGVDLSEPSTVRAVAAQLDDLVVRLEAELAGAVDGMLADIDRSRGEIDRFCCHPGGVKVIDAIESALDLPVGTLDLEREVLNDCGNMSAPTVLFVLDRLIARGLPERTMLTSFGPGFTCAGMLLERA